MAGSLSLASRNDRLTTLNTDIGAAATIDIVSGARPAGPGAALTGTVLATLTCDGTAFGVVSAGALTANTITPGTAGAAGKASHARVKQSGGTAVLDLNVSQNWAASTPYALNQQVNKSGLTYKCTTAGTSAASGGPTGTGSGIADGTAVWAYVGTTDLIIATTDIAISATVGTGMSLVLTEGNP